MKKLNVLYVFILMLFNLKLNSQNPIIKINSGTTGGNNGKCVQIGSENTNGNLWYLSLGKGTGTPNWGAWGLEHWDGGLNFWKPYPTSNFGNYKLHITDDGFVGINGKANSSLNVGGSSNIRLQIFGNAVSDRWLTFSDSSIKENVVNIQNVLPALMKINPIEYNYKSIDLSSPRSACDPKEGITDNLPTTDSLKRYGFTAQNIKRIFPILTSNLKENIGVVDYVGFVPLLVKGMQEQQAIIDSQSLQIQLLRQEIINWKGRSIDSINQSQTRLFQNNPNPFDAHTTFTYFIDENSSFSSATIEVRNIMGVIQNILALGDRSGLGRIEYDASNLSIGYYIFSLKIDGIVKDSKMFLKEQ